MVLEPQPTRTFVLEQTGKISRDWNEWLQRLVDKVNGVQQTLTGSGAINQDTTVSYLNGNGAIVAATLADGDGIQTIEVKAIDVTFAVTLVPDNFRDGTTITFSTVDQYIILKWDGSMWNVFGGNAVIS